MSDVREMEVQISNILRAGVLLSGLLLLLGLGILGLTGDFSCPTNVLDLEWVMHGDPFFAPSHIIFLGFFVLILTPLLRIIANVILYLRLKDLTFAIINGTVLVILLSSMLFGLG